MKLDAYGSAIAANAVLEELVRLLIAKKVVSDYDAKQAIATAQRNLNSTGDPAFKEAAKALPALYYR